MANQRMKESWTSMKTDIRAIWGEDLSDAVLEKGRRDLRKMVSVLHENTGNPRSQIRERIALLL